jgi:GT2 family glycosyltransferase
MSLVENQSRKADEIIVVNGGGENDCSKTLDHWQKKCSYLRVINTQNINLANSRNIGMAVCTGELILMTDDDAKPYSDWIGQIVAAHKNHPEAGAIGGEVVDAGGTGFLGRIADITTFPKWEKLTEVSTVPGVNCSYKRTVVQQIGEQDIKLFRGEDVDYNWRVLLAGFKVLYEPDIKVFHYHRPSWQGLFRQHHMYGRAYFRVRAKWPQMYCTYPHRLNSLKMWMKGFYFWVRPFPYAFKKTQYLPTFFEKLKAFPIICALSYYHMYGTFLQMLSDKMNRANLNE